MPDKNMIFRVTILMAVKSSPQSTGVVIQDQLRRVREMVEQGNVEGGRLLAETLSREWPHSEEMLHFARVLAPPEVLAREGERGRTLQRERAWLKEHAHEHPGEWLAVYEEALLASSADLERVLAAVRASAPGGEPLLHFQPAPNSSA